MDARHAQRVTVAVTRLALSTVRNPVKGELSFLAYVLYLRHDYASRVCLPVRGIPSCDIRDFTTKRLLARIANIFAISSSSIND